MIQSLIISILALATSFAALFGVNLDLNDKLGVAPRTLTISQGGTSTSTAQANAIWFGSSGGKFFTQDGDLTYATTTDTLTLSNLTVGGTCTGCGGGGASADWNQQLNYGALALTPTTTIPIWAKDMIYGSSTLIMSGTGTSTFAGKLSTGTTTLNLNSRILLSSSMDAQDGSNSSLTLKYRNDLSDSAKANIAFQSSTSTKAWIAAHDYLDPTTYHGHLSFETKNAADNSLTTKLSIDHSCDEPNCMIETSNANVRITDGYLQIGTVANGLQLTEDTALARIVASSTLPWQIASTTGIKIGGVGAPAALLHVERQADSVGVKLDSQIAAANGSALLLLESGAAGGTGIQGLVQGDSVNRFIMNTSGAMQWGSGSATRDLGISRGAASALYIGTGASGNSEGTLIVGKIGIGTTTPYARLSVVGETVGSYFTATSTTASSTFIGVTANALNVTSTAATSTFANGIQLSAGCFRLSDGVCLGELLTVARGGTGATTLGFGELLVGAGTGAVTSTTTANLKASMSLNLVENTALSTWAGSANLTTTGTLTSGGLGNNYTILNGTGPTVDAAGEIAVDTTSDQLIYYGIAKKVLTGNLYPAFTYSTSTAWTGTTTIPLGTAFVAETWNAVQCFTDVGTLNVTFGDGTNDMTMLNASTTVGTITFATNNTFTAAEKREVEIGTPATAPKKLSCTVSKSITAD